MLFLIRLRGNLPGIVLKIGAIVPSCCDPSVHLSGVGRLGPYPGSDHRFDRGLGGFEMDLRLRDHLAKLFNEQKKSKKDVRENHRAMAKLLKEAQRLKTVLSANADFMAQVSPWEEARRRWWPRAVLSQPHRTSSPPRWKV